jgi:hypothetical protein
MTQTFIIGLAVSRVKPAEVGNALVWLIDDRVSVGAATLCLFANIESDLG